MKSRMRSDMATSGLPRPPRRVYPQRGRLLGLSNIRGPWRPSGTVAGAGIFAVVWSTPGGDFWAALHDFEPSDQLRLVGACRWIDRIAGTDEQQVQPR